ncbi:MAG: proline dehydrogenase family protein [Acidobacteria bacterium]|nr:proline dehydrogenase family protein [Acidobacteriota bacterium]
MFRSFFISLSQNRKLRSWLENSSAGRKISSRFVAGMTIEDAIAACRRVNALGMQVSLDSLGENVNSERQAYASAAVYHTLLEVIARERLDANVSLKLTQMGIDLSPSLTEEIVCDLAGKARKFGSFIRIDMESTRYTQATLDMVRRLNKVPSCTGAVGAVLQAYLYRTEKDADLLLREGIRIRLCKGAYKEDSTHAFQDKAETDRNYIRLMQRMVTSPVFCGIATHDEAIINATKQFVTDHGISRDAFEFQMLYGIRRDLQQRLVREGYRVRVYIPFGPEWYPYFMRRLAERPANVLFLLKSLFRK